MDSVRQMTLSSILSGGVYVAISCIKNTVDQHISTFLKWANGPMRKSVSWICCCLEVFACTIVCVIILN